MKREIGAVLLLGIMIALSLWNLRRLDALTTQVEAHLARSEKALLAGDRERAEEELDAAGRVWRAGERFTHVYIRHPENDCVNDAFFSLHQGLAAGDGKELSAAYALLRYHLDAIDYMEHVSLGSVF